MFHKVVVANRGAVARRVIRALRALGVRSVALYSEADRDLPYLAEADEALPIGPAEARASYLNVEAILAAARAAGADAVHPGYGFLSENAPFAAAVEAAGLRFVGPSPRWIEAMGLKPRARAIMRDHGLPMVPGTDALPDDEGAALAEAAEVGFPLLVKPSGGGGGIGMLAARDLAELKAALPRARSLAERAFGNGEVYVERLLARPRHVEFQILADRHGAACHLFERDCSLQRRHQKVIEEAPAPLLARSEVEAMAERAARVMGGLGYDNIGTVEMLHDGAAGFSFLEVNTRLQVEHAVTEAVTGIDIVAAQVRLAAGERLPDVLPAEPAIRGHAIEARVYAEDPWRFLPSPGRLAVFRPPSGAAVRVETGYAEGAAVTLHYDPMIAKVIAWGEDRERARRTLADALAAFAIEGVKTNLAFLCAALADETFRGGAVYTGLAAEIVARRPRG